jgi:hypothetical protein
MMAYKNLALRMVILLFLESGHKFCIMIRARSRWGDCIHPLGMFLISSFHSSTPWWSNNILKSSMEGGFHMIWIRKSRTNNYRNVSHITDEISISCDWLSMDFDLQDGTHQANLVNFQVSIKFSQKSRIDCLAIVHALPIVFLKNMVDEVKWRHHHILSYNGMFYHDGLLFDPCLCSGNLSFWPSARGIYNLEQKQIYAEYVPIIQTIRSHLHIRHSMTKLIA